MDREQLKRVLEALIFASESPLTLNQMVAILEDIEQADIESALTELPLDLANRAIYLKKAAGGYQFGTRAEYAEWIGRMFQEKKNSRLSRAALETLAIIAFKQPISRVEVAAIRGVNADGVMKKLLDFRLITISGRDTGPGRPLLFKTTSEFLNYFGINDVSELPRPKEVEELLAEGEGGEILQHIPDEVLMSEDAATASDDDENADPDEKMQVDDGDDSHAASPAKPLDENSKSTDQTDTAESPENIEHSDDDSDEDEQ